MRYLTTTFLIYSTILSQEVVTGYWNSLSTHVTVGVPLLDDETLIRGRIQLKVSFNGGNSFVDLGEKAIIEKANMYPGIAKARIKAQLKKLLNGKS